MKGVRQLFGIGSIRGRLTYALLGLVVLLFAAAGVADREMRNALRLGDESSGNRADMEQVLKGLTDHIWAAQVALQDFMWLPDANQARTLDRSIDNAMGQIEALSRLPWADKSPSAQRLIADTRARLDALRGHAHAAMAVRADPEKLYPANRIIREALAGTMLDLITATALAMDEAAGEDGPIATEIYRLYVGARHDATMIANTFRAYMAYRFELMPGDAAVGMRKQDVAISDYAGSIRRTLGRLAELQAQGALGIQAEQSLMDMQRLLDKWLAGYRKIEALYKTDRWRMDVPIMRDVALPAFGAVFANIVALREQAGLATTEDVAALADTSHRLSKIVFSLALIFVVFAVLTAISFELWIRRPVARVAQALRQEAEGGAPAAVTGDLAETRDLAAAFDGMRAQVRARQQRLETILNNAAEGIVTFDIDGLIESVNRAAEKLFGYSEAELKGKDIGAIIPPADERDARPGYVEHFMRKEIARLLGHEGEVSGKHKDGTRFPMALKVSKIDLDGRPLYTGLVADISERKALIEHLREMAEHDGLTGLYNRTYLQQELERVVERVRRNKTQCALLYIDLDNFKYVNDTLGHAAGDKLLTEVAGVLNKRARKSDLIARLGGDEFAILLYDIVDTQADAVAESFRVALANYKFTYKGERVDIGCSIGVAALDSGVQTAAQVLSHADMACHFAKRGGRNRVYTFNHADTTKVVAMSLDMGWSRRIKDAIEHNHFRLACQPIIDLNDKRADTYEVLLRLQHNDELVLPGGFLPVAERFGFAVEIDKWVIVHAIDTLVVQRRLAKDLRYSINLSAQSLSDRSVFQLIAERLAATRLPPTALTFEVTETAAIADMGPAQAFLSQLQALGCKTALDDFGVGFSSFAYLQDLPVDIVKIDGRFVKNVATSPVDQAMVRAMNDIAHALGKVTVAECVESEDSLRWLAACGVDYAQGYHFGRPDVMVPCEAIADSANVLSRCYL